MKFLQGHSYLIPDFELKALSESPLRKVMLHLWSIGFFRYISSLFSYINHGVRRQYTVKCCFPQFTVQRNHWGSV